MSDIMTNKVNNFGIEREDNLYEMCLIRNFHTIHTIVYVYEHIEITVKLCRVGYWKTVAYFGNGKDNLAEWTNVVKENCGSGNGE